MRGRERPLRLLNDWATKLDELGVELNYALLDRVVVLAVMNQIPSALGYFAGIRGVRVLSKFLDKLNLENLNLIFWLALRQPRERLAHVVAPHVGGDYEAVAKMDSC
jgi:hypothetical protein